MKNESRRVFFISNLVSMKSVEQAGLQLTLGGTWGGKTHLLLVKFP